MTQIDTERGTKEDDATEGSPETVVSLELRPESHYVQTVIWFGYVIALFVGLALMFSGLQNSYLLFFLLFGAGSILPWAFLTPTLPGRAPRWLEVTPEKIRFLHGSVVKKPLLWGRVESIEWGALIWRRRKGAYYEQKRRDSGLTSDSLGFRCWHQSG